MMNIIELYQAYPGFLLFTLILVGLIFGSFLNVVIYRLPIMLKHEWTSQCKQYLEIDDSAAKVSPYNLLTPRSQCPHCHHLIPAWQNIPVISYLLLGGKCRQCQQRIGFRYPLIEILTAGLTVVLYFQFGAGWQMFSAIIFIYFLIILTAIDIDTQLLPDQLTLLLLWIGLLVNTQMLFVPLQEAVLGAILGYLSLWSIYHLYRLATKKEGFGYGDFKLLAALGAWVGWTMLPVIILLSSITGVIAGILMILSRRHSYTNPLPFGPYLAIAGGITILWGNDILDFYWQLVSLA
ncbi:MAG: prepilin peptidase [Gammaproteobacteria bacterium]|nr:prepilin peptidase [Gammaproteobacteria bacterium]